jgi:hypothetical protein
MPIESERAVTYVPRNYLTISFLYTRTVFLLKSAHNQLLYSAPSQEKFVKFRHVREQIKFVKENIARGFNY